jgi:uncharacterized membrane protein YcgQ (UPF0703/DUF1980 family)
MSKIKEIALGIAFIFVEMVTILLIALKITNNIDWDWSVILSPLIFKLCISIWITIMVSVNRFKKSKRGSKKKLLKG